MYCELYNSQGFYDTMDAGYMDADGYVFVTARADDVINVAGHRISTFCLEDAVLRHTDVADAAVFGVPEPTKGEVPCCLYIAKAGVKKTPAKLSAEIVQTIRDIIGPIASFRLIAPVQALPRTRSGKLLSDKPGWPEIIPYILYSRAFPTRYTFSTCIFLYVFYENNNKEINKFIWKIFNYN